MIRNAIFLFLAFFPNGVCTGRADDGFTRRVQPLVAESCIDCHDGSDSNGLDFNSLGNDLNDPATFAKWERIYDRINTGEMPPETEARPSPSNMQAALNAVDLALTSHCRTRQQTEGRVVLRRLTRTEYEYALRDLLSINAELSVLIPEENSSTSFDTVFDSQGFSTQHIRGYFAAADRALEHAIRLEPEPESGTRHFEYKQHPAIRKHIDEKEEHVIIGETDDAVVMFSNASYLYKVPDFHVPTSGYYKIRAAAYPYQSNRPVVLTLNAGSYQRGYQDVIGFFDLEPGETTEVEVEVYLDRQQYLFPGVHDVDVQPDGKTIWNIGPKNYQGSGVALKWIEVEGPLFDQWPPKSTTDFLADASVKKLAHDRWDSLRGIHQRFELSPGSNPKRELESIVTRLAERAFRRPLVEGEIARFVSLGTDALATGRTFDESLRIACRAVLSSPEFLFFAAQPGPLDDHALASRLSFFLWKSIPDGELLRLAKENRLHESDVLKKQIDRMLRDRKSQRFVEDFVDQWLQLSEIDATSPDENLYPEYDQLLKKSMMAETREFVAYLIENDLSSSNLIDSDFAILNRRLAEHYGISDIKGQHLRPVALPEDSLRGGLLTQASVLKVTANGTTTSPVRRGSWVLTHLLGQPPSPPPSTVGTIEPDTRGATTVREMLDKHRNDPSCASCHRLIDPPGFALESFDVIGGYRERFRSKEKGERPENRLHGRSIWEYKLGLPVDSHGQLADGRRFQGIREYKQLLMNESELVTRNLIEQLLVYSTGAKIDFSDREVVEDILKRVRNNDLGVRSMIYEVVDSRLFRHK
jgi:hypothetical protein